MCSKSGECPVVSVIIPFYNAEETIERTAMSLVNQSYQGDVEYIFINDGSTDRSVDVLQAFFVLHPEFRAEHVLLSAESNRGSATSQMIGWEHARGEYVLRCDADDYLSPDALQLLVDATDNGRYDMVVAPIIEEHGERSLVMNPAHSSNLNDLPLTTANFSLCNRLLRRSIIVDNDLMPFAGIDCWEDLGVVARYFALEPSVNWISTPIYHYVKEISRPTLTSADRDRILSDHLAIALLLEKWFVERGLAEKYGEFLNYLKFTAKVKYLRGRGKNVEKWKLTFPEVNGRITGLRHIGLLYRLMFTAVSILPASLTQAVADLYDYIAYSRK